MGNHILGTGKSPITVLDARFLRSGKNRLLLDTSFGYHFPFEHKFGDSEFQSTFSLVSTVIEPGKPTLISAVPDPRMEREDPKGRTLLSFCRITISPETYANLHQEKPNDDIVAISHVISAPTEGLADWQEKKMTDSEWFKSLTGQAANDSRIVASYMGVSTHMGRIRARVERFGDGDEVSTTGTDLFECDPESVANLVRDGDETHGASRNARFAWGFWRFGLLKGYHFTQLNRFHDLGDRWEEKKMKMATQVLWSSGLAAAFPDAEPQLSGFAHFDEENGDPRLLLFFTRAFTLARTEK